MRDDAPVPHRRRCLVSTARPARLLALAGLLAVAGCGDGSAGAGACGPITREALDPAYLVHVLGDDGTVEYTSDPPTSGRHQPGPEIAGVVDEALPRPIQVGILERGDILVQHDPELARRDRAALEALAGPGVVVAPNPDLPAPIVATAWTYKRTCTEVDRAELQEFVDERAGKGPEG